jgi:hypothetical protein
VEAGMGNRYKIFEMLYRFFVPKESFTFTKIDQNLALYSISNFAEEI